MGTFASHLIHTVGIREEGTSGLLTCQAIYIASACADPKKAVRCYRYVLACTNRGAKRCIGNYAHTQYAFVRSTFKTPGPVVPAQAV